MDTPEDLEDESEIDRNERLRQEKGDREYHRAVDEGRVTPFGILPRT